MVTASAIGISDYQLSTLSVVLEMLALGKTYRTNSYPGRLFLDFSLRRSTHESAMSQNRDQVDPAIWTLGSPCKVTISVTSRFYCFVDERIVVQYFQCGVVPCHL
jgi:hypothetical protein